MATIPTRVEQYASREYFYVGGEYVDEGDGKVFMKGQMYVEKLTPRDIDPGEESGANRWPVVFVHGGGQSGTNFLNKPNNTGPGLASHFLRKKYTVFIIDQTYRGRSPSHPSPYIDEVNLQTWPTSEIEEFFTATKKHMLWDQAAKHTQWPGTGQRNDPTFDAYYSTLQPSISSPQFQQKAMQSAGAALLDLIGPVVLVGHSQGAIVPWLWADIRPHLVKAILSLEPNGPPFRQITFGTKERRNMQNYGYGKAARQFGISDIPLNFSRPSPKPKHDLTGGIGPASSLSKPQFGPAVSKENYERDEHGRDVTSAEAAYDAKSPLVTELSEIRDSDLRDGEVRHCILQCEPARNLINLMHIPVLVVTAEASYHAMYDRCTVKFLKQAGVDAEWLRLEDVGIHGNGHMFFLEKNSEEIAEVLEGWLSKTLAT